MNEKTQWTVKELAQAGKVTPARIRQLLLDGTIKGKKYGGTSRGGFWVISDTEARRFLEGRQP